MILRSNKSNFFYILVLLSLFFIFNTQLLAKVYGVTCSDGSHHGADFDCEKYISNKNNISNNINYQKDNNIKYKKNKYKLKKQQEEKLLKDKERKRLKEEEKNRKKKFELGKQNILKILKTGVGTVDFKSNFSGDIGFKKLLFSKGNKNSAMPDFRNLNQKWPIVVDISKVQGKTQKDLYDANYKTHILLDALEANPGNWKGSIQYLQNRLEDSPNNLAIRDTLNLVLGYYSGYLGSKRLSNKHYKYGVRRWLAGDLDQSSRAFAIAYREDPDNELLLQSFAHALGMRNNSSRCKNNKCGFLEIPTKSFNEKYDDVSQMRDEIYRIKKELSSNPENLKLRTTLNYLEGSIGYINYINNAPKEKISRINEIDVRAIVYGLKKLGEKNYIAALKKLDKELKDNIDKKVIIFATYYAKGLNAPQTKKGIYIPGPLPIKDTLTPYEQFLKENAARQLFRVKNQALDPIIPDLLVVGALMDESELSVRELSDYTINTKIRNPYFGPLSEKEIERIKEKWPSFY